jgi:hypothetical protein
VVTLKQIKCGTIEEMKTKLQYIGCVDTYCIISADSKLFDCLCLVCKDGPYTIIILNVVPRIW